MTLSDTQYSEILLVGPSLVYLILILLQQQKNVTITLRTSLTGLSVLLRNAIVIIYSRDVLQPPGIRRFGNGVSQLSPFRPALDNGDPLIVFYRNALTIERVLQRPAPSHLWTTSRSRIRYPTSQ